MNNIYIYIYIVVGARTLKILNAHSLCTIEDKKARKITSFTAYIVVFVCKKDIKCILMSVMRVRAETNKLWFPY